VIFVTFVAFVLKDRIRPGVRVLFVGINPGIRSAMTGHHFAGFSNRFWKLLFESRLVPEPIGYADDVRLPEWGYGITNIVPRPTPGIDTLQKEEYVAGRVRLRRKILRYKPAVVAAIGVTVFRAMFPGRRGAVTLGLQPERIGDSAVNIAQSVLQLSEQPQLKPYIDLPHLSELVQAMVRKSLDAFVRRLHGAVVDDGGKGIALGTAGEEADRHVAAPLVPQRLGVGHASKARHRCRRQSGRGNHRQDSL